MTTETGVSNLMDDTQIDECIEKYTQSLDNFKEILYDEYWAKFFQLNNVTKIALRMQRGRCHETSSTWVVCSTPELEIMYDVKFVINEDPRYKTCYVESKVNQIGYLCRIYNKFIDEPEDIRYALYQAIRKELLLFKATKELMQIDNLHEVYESKDTIAILYEFHPRDNIEAFLLDLKKPIEESKMKKMVKRMLDCIFPIYKVSDYHGALKLNMFQFIGRYSKKLKKKTHSAICINNLGLIEEVYAKELRKYYGPATPQDIFYWAPECFGDKPQLTDKTDSFALGAMLFMFKYNHPPFLNEEVDFNDFEDDMQETVEKGFTMVTKSSKGPWFCEEVFATYEFKDLLGHCLKADPADRLNLKDIYTHPFLLDIWNDFQLTENLVSYIEEGYLRGLNPDLLKFVQTIFKNVYTDDFRMYQKSHQKALESSDDKYYPRDELVHMIEHNIKRAPDEMDEDFEDRVLSMVEAINCRDDKVEKDDLATVVMMVRTSDYAELIKTELTKVDRRSKGVIPRNNFIKVMKTVLGTEKTKEVEHVCYFYLENQGSDIEYQALIDMVNAF